jgi:nitrate/nitrite transporter NarK
MPIDAIDHTTEAERSLVRKLDTRLLPLVTAYYFVAYVNRVNVANVHTELTEALGLTEEQLSWVISIFFTSFIVFEVPSNLCLKRLSPRKWLAFLGLAWGVSSMALAWSSSYASILIARVFLGIFQAG